MVCDIIAASKTYNGKNFTPNMPYDYWINKLKETTLMHKDSQEFVRLILKSYAENGDIVLKKQYTKIICNGKFVFTARLYRLLTGRYGFETSENGKPFVINGDMFNNNAHHYRFGSYEELENAAKTDKRVKWLLENTTFKKRLLNIAIDHIDLPIPFTFDVVKYCRRLKKCGKISKRFLQEEVE